MTRTNQAAFIADALTRVLADVARVGLTPRAGLYDLLTRRWVSGSGRAPSGFTGDGFVLRVEGNDHLLNADEPGDVVDAVSFVQDWAIDQLGTGWPELNNDDGAFVAVLSPALVDGDLVWRAKDERITLVGDLAASTRSWSNLAAGRRSRPAGARDHTHSRAQKKPPINGGFSGGDGGI